MLKKSYIITIIVPLLLFSASCSNKKESKMGFTGEPGEVRLMTLDPGHFHASLVQKTMYDQVSPVVYVYAPGGSDVEVHLKQIESFNTRETNPAHWEEKVYTGEDFFKRMIAEKPGNVMITAGNNRKKTEYIKASVDAGIHVLSDKPMCIDRAGFALLKEAFGSAERNNVLLYDIMTERHEITSILQKELVHAAGMFGEILPGTPDDPSVIKESVHHIFKYVAGSPIQRPEWYFDVTRQGEGLVDISTHLVDLVMWGCFPEQIIDYTSDVEIKRARRWPTMVSIDQFEKVTRSADFPDYLKTGLDENGVLPYYCNGDMVFEMNGIHAKTSVIWNFEAPEGSGDTHYSVIKGTKASVVILQDKAQNYRPELYVEQSGKTANALSEDAVERAVSSLEKSYPGIDVEKDGDRWHVLIPDSYRIGHEAHFGQVAEKYLGYLVDGKLPGWEVPNMLSKYYITTGALEMAHENEKNGK
ncbi:putative oxidoreductase C-terminal domain-containing protein [Candidatus Latescibacterota bacterium]